MTMISMLLLSCAEKQPEPVIAEAEPLPFEFDGKLQDIDTLLQHDAANALQKLLSFDTQSVIFNDNYHKLLLSEALYKTDNPQDGFVETHGRASLQAAMRFFDSLTAQYPADDDLTVLSARSHYMNGVGFNENDSIVEACKEYLHTLEIMENHFDVEKLNGYKAKFMGLTYNRLKELFTSQFMVEPAIYCGKKSLYYCKIAPTSKYGVSNNLAKLGTLYDISDQTDSAYYYYNEALKALPDTNNLIYRDLVSSLALLSYKLGYGLQPSLEKLFYVAKHANSEDELLTRYFTIGGIYYEENMYDSAVKYLYRVFEYEGDYMRRQQAADFLMNIHHNSGDTVKTNKYTTYLAKNATRQYDNMAKVSLLDNIFYDYVKRHQSETSPNRKNKHIIFIIIAIVAATTIIYIIYRRKRKEIEDKKDDNLKLMVENQRLKKYLGSKENKNFVSLRKVAIAIYNEQRNNSLEHILKVFDSYYPKVSDELTNKFTNLSKTEHDLVILSFIGFRIKEEAEILGISENTVGKYRSNIRKKAGKTPVFDIL